MQPLEAFLDDVPPGFDVKAALPPESQTVARRNVIRALKSIADGDCLNPYKAPAVIDCDSSKGGYNVGYSPCITASRGAAGGHWISSRGRRFTVNEMVKLMGVDPARVHDATENESARVMGQILGNAVPATLIRKVYEKLLPAIGIRVP